LGQEHSAQPQEHFDDELEDALEDGHGTAEEDGVGVGDSGEGGELEGGGGTKDGFADQGSAGEEAGHADDDGEGVSSGEPPAVGEGDKMNALTGAPHGQAAEEPAGDEGQDGQNEGGGA
jgi:hypothetical protein